MPSRPWLRWLAPLAAVLALITTALVAGNAAADETLPPRTAEQLLTDLQQAEPKGLSGTVAESADLGIPALPGVSERGADFASLASGSHTLRVAYAAPDKSKVALQGELSEASVIRDGTNVWTWSSRDNAVTHATIDPNAKADDRPQGLPSDAPKTPQEAAQRILSAVADTTEVSVAKDATVAGRPAYELVLRPKDTRSLLSSIQIAVDGTEHVALGVKAFAGDHADPVASIEFTEIDFSTPPDSEFAFTPPEGAKVTEVTPGQHDRASTAEQSKAEPTVVGDGWTRVVVGKIPADAQAGTDQQGSDHSVDLNAYVAQLPKVSGSWGSGRLLAGTAFSVVFTDDGRVAAGAVPPELLYHALG